MLHGAQLGSYNAGNHTHAQIILFKKHLIAQTWTVVRNTEMSKLKSVMDKEFIILKNRLNDFYNKLVLLMI